MTITINEKFHLAHIYGAGLWGSNGTITLDPNCVASGYVTDDLLPDGYTSVTVVDPTKPARFFATGGDYINEPRQWWESGEFIPGKGWEAREINDWHSKEARLFWLQGGEIVRKCPHCGTGNRAFPAVTPGQTCRYCGKKL